MSRTARLVSLWFGLFSLIFTLFLFLVGTLRLQTGFIWIFVYLSALFSSGFTAAAYYWVKLQDTDTDFEDESGMISEMDGLPKGISIYYQHAKHTYSIEFVTNLYTRIDFGNALIIIDHLNDNQISVTPRDHRIGFKVDNGKSILIIGNYKEE